MVQQYCVKGTRAKTFSVRHMPTFRQLRAGGGVGVGGLDVAGMGVEGGLNWSGVDPPLSSSRACLTTFIAISVP